MGGWVGGWDTLTACFSEEAPPSLAQRPPTSPTTCTSPCPLPAPPAVILLLEHDDGEGSSGLVLNMPTPLMIGGLGLEEDIAGGCCATLLGAARLWVLRHAASSCRLPALS